MPNKVPLWSGCRRWFTVQQTVVTSVRCGNTPAERNIGTACNSGKKRRLLRALQYRTDRWNPVCAERFRGHFTTFSGQPALLNRRYRGTTDIMCMIIYNIYIYIYIYTWYIYNIYMYAQAAGLLIGLTRLLQHCACAST